MVGKRSLGIGAARIGILAMLGVFMFGPSVPAAGGEPPKLDEQLDVAASGLSDPGARKEAIKSLVARRPEASEIEDRIVNALGAALADLNDPELQLAILERLDKSRSSAVPTALAKSLKEPPDNEALVSKLLDVFARRATAEQLPLLLDLARRDHPFIREPALKAIDAINSVAALDALTGLAEEGVQKGKLPLADGALSLVRARLRNQFDEWKGDPGFDRWAQRTLRLVPSAAALEKGKLKETVTAIAAALATPADIPLLAQADLQDALPGMASRWAMRTDYEDILAMILGEDKGKREFGLALLARRAAELPVRDVGAFYSRIARASGGMSFVTLLYRVLSVIPVARASEETRAALVAKAREALSHDRLGPTAAACVNRLGGTGDERKRAEAALDRRLQELGISFANIAFTGENKALPEVLEWGDPRLLPAIRNAIDKGSGDLTVQVALVRSLRSYTDAEAGRLALQAVEHSYGPIRVAGADALKFLQPEGSAAALIEALQADSWEVQLAASCALAWYADPKLDATLAELLKSPEWRTRAAAVLTLGRRQNPDALARIADRVSDRPVCRYAVEALGLHGSPEATRQLVALLTTSKDPNVLRFAAETAARHGVRDAIAALEALRNEDSVEIAGVARAALFDLEFNGARQ